MDIFGGGGKAHILSPKCVCSGVEITLELEGWLRWKNTCCEHILSLDSR